MIDYQQVGKMIAMLRQKKGLSQQGLAVLCSVTHQAVSKWENGQALPDLQTLLFLGKYFGVSMEEVLMGKREEIASPLPPPLDVERQAQAPEKDERTPPAPEEVTAPDPEEEADLPPMDWQQILALAPFADQKTVEALLDRHLDTLDPHALVGLAPFVSPDYLDRAAAHLEGKFSFPLLTALAPFLPAQRIGRMLETALVKKKQSENQQSERQEKTGCKPPMAAEEGRATPEQERIQMRIARKAVADGDEAWLTEYGEELNREELREICLLAAEEGMWGALEHLAEHADEETLAALTKKAVDSGEWDTVEEWAEHLDPPFSGALMLQAADKDQWETAQRLLPSSDPSSCRAFLEKAATQDRWDAAAETLEYVKREDLLKILEKAADQSNWKLIHLISQNLSSETAPK